MKPGQRGIFYGTMLFVLFAASSAFAMPDNNAGTVIAARKQAWAERARERPVLASKSPVYVGDLLITNEMGRLQVLFQDDSVFMMAPDTEVKVTEYLYGGEVETRFTLDLAKGVTRLISGQMTEKGGKIQINTPEARAVIQGTTVCVQHSLKGTAVLVLEGDLQKPTLIYPTGGRIALDPDTHQPLSNTGIKQNSDGSLAVPPGSGLVISGGKIFLIPIPDIPTYAAANFGITCAAKDTPEDVMDEVPASGEGSQGGTMSDTTQDFQTTATDVADTDFATSGGSDPTGNGGLTDLVADSSVGPWQMIDAPSSDRFLTYTGTLSGTAASSYQGTGAYAFIIKNLQSDAPMVTQVDFAISLSAMSDGSAAGGIQAQGHGDLATVNGDGTFNFTGNAVGVATTGTVGTHTLSGADSLIEAQLPSDSIAPGAVEWQVLENGDSIGIFSGAVTTPDKTVDPKLKR